MAIFIDIVQVITGPRSATMEFSISNDSQSNTETVTVEITPSLNVIGDSQRTYSVGPLRQVVDTADFNFNNDVDMQQEFCVNQL